jgi:hypothetical protein
MERPNRNHHHRKGEPEQPRVGLAPLHPPIQHLARCLTISSSSEFAKATSVGGLVFTSSINGPLGVLTRSILSQEQVALCGWKRGAVAPADADCRIRPARRNTPAKPSSSNARSRRPLRPSGAAKPMARFSARTGLAVRGPSRSVAHTCSELVGGSVSADPRLRPPPLLGFEPLVKLHRTAPDMRGLSEPSFGCPACSISLDDP